MDTFDFNTGLHVAYDPKRDLWEERAQGPRHVQAMVCSIGESCCNGRRGDAASIRANGRATPPCRRRVTVWARQSLAMLFTWLEEVL
jgi:hypothetical protein